VTRRGAPRRVSRNVVVRSRRTVHSAVPDRASHDQTHVFLDDGVQLLVPWGMAAAPDDGALYIAADLSYDARAWRLWGVW